MASDPHMSEPGNSPTPAAGPPGAAPPPHGPGLPRRRPGEPGDLRRLLARSPHWAVALAMLLPVLVIGQGSLLLLVPGVIENDWHPQGLVLLFLLALFLPGAVKRLNWRHALVMVVFAALAIGAAEAQNFLSLPRPAAVPAPLIVPVGVFVLVLLVGLGEMVVARQRDGLTFVWLLAAALATGCTVGLVEDLALWAGWQINIPTGNGAHEHLKMAFLLYQLLVVMLTWTWVPALLAARAGGARGRGRLAAGTIAAAVLAFAGFYGFLAYPLAERSLDGNGPFLKSRAALLLELRGRQPDFDRFWEDLAAADWTRGPSPRENPDWRDAYIGILARHDAAGAADRLSALLREKPALTLAWFSAQLLARNKRYETVPLLMRFALRGREGSEACTVAMETLDFPQAAYPTLREAAVCAERTRNLQEAEDFELEPEYRQHLTDLLGCDAGPNYSDWEALYDAAARYGATPLAPETREETDQTIQSFAQYWQTQERLRHARRRMAEEMLTRDNKTDATDAFEQWCSRYGEDPNPPRPDQEVQEGFRIIQEYLRKAAKVLAVQGPDWNVPTTQEFMGEIAAYAERVDAAIDQHLGGGDAAGQLP